MTIEQYTYKCDICGKKFLKVVSEPDKLPGFEIGINGILKVICKECY